MVWAINQSTNSQFLVGGGSSGGGPSAWGICSPTPQSRRSFCDPFGLKASSLLVSGRQLSARSLVRRFLGTRRCFAFAGTSLLQGGSWLDRRRDGAILAAAKLNEQTELLGHLIERGEKRYCLLLLQDLLEVVSQPPHRILLETYSRLHAELTGEPETLDPEVDD